MHPAANKAQEDTTYKEMNSSAGNEGSIYNSLSGVRKQEADKLLAVIQTNPPQKTSLHMVVIPEHTVIASQEDSPNHNLHPERTPML
jgi:hypothetical protein